MIKIDFSKIVDTARMVMFTEKSPAELRGRRLPILGEPLYIRYDDKFDILTCTLIKSDDPEYVISKGKTLNQLCKEGYLKDWTPYKQLDIDNILPPLYDTTSSDLLYNPESININVIIEEVTALAKEGGFKITEEAIIHQIRAWLNDYKSGYRDEAGNYHIFTACSHNSLCFRITELSPLCDWQTTYEV